MDRLLTHLILSFLALLLSIGICQADESNDSAELAHLSSLSGGSSTDSNKTITIVGSRNIPPFSMLNQDGEPIGIGIDMWRLWSEKSGISVRFRLTDISRSLEELKEGRADLHAGLLFSEQRSHWLDFTQPFIETSAFLYYVLKDGNPRSLADFSKSRIGTQGPIPQQVFKKLLPQATQEVFENIPQMIHAVNNGEIDAFIADQPSTDFTLLRVGRRGDFQAVDKPLFKVSLHAAVPKAKPELFESVSEGLGAIDLDEMNAILARWIDQSTRLSVELPLQGTLKLTPKEEIWLQSHKHLRIAVDPDFAPYEFIGEAGRHRGVSADMIQLIARKIGVDLTLISTSSWEQALEMAAKRQVDLLPLANRTPQRALFLDFTEPYLLSKRHIITRRQNSEIQTEADLSRQTLALPAGYSINSVVRKRWPEISINEVVDIPTALQQVAFGAADATILSSGVAGYWLDKNEISNLKVAGTLGQASSLSIATRNDWPELTSILQKALQSIDENQRNAIRRRWLFFDEPAVEGKQYNLTEAERDWIEAHPVVRVGVNTQLQPIGFIGEDGQYRGLSADYLKLLEKRLGLHFKMVTGSDWSGLLDQVQSHQLDMIGALSLTDERQQYMRFTLPYHMAVTKLYLRNDEIRISGLKDLSGMKVAVEKDSWLHERLSIDYPSIDLLVVENSRQALQAVKNSQADAYIGMQRVADRLIKADHLLGLKPFSMAENLNQTELRIGVRKDWPVLPRIIDKILTNTSPEEHRMLKKQWFASDDVASAESLVLNQQERNWLARHKRIKIGVMDAWPPMDFVDAQGNALGIGVDVIEALNRRLGGILEPEPGPWDEQFAAVKAQSLAAVLDITPTDERKQNVLFTDPYLTIPHVIVTQKSHPVIRQISDLADSRVALEKDFMLGQVIVEHYPEVSVVEYKNTSDALDAVSRGEVEAYIGNRAGALYLIEHELISNLKIQSKIKETASVNAIGVRKDWPILRDILQKALATLTREELRRILRKWVPNVDDQAELPDRKARLQLTPEERSWLAEHQQLRIGIDPDWEPIEYIDREGKHRGISADFLARIKEMTGMNFIYSASLSWSQVIEAAQRGDIDILPAITPSSERARYLEFTQSYLHFPLMVFTRSDAPFIAGIDDLNGLSISVERQYVTQEYLKNDYPGLALKQVDTTANALQALATGEVDAYIGNLTMASYLIDKLGLGNLKVAAPTSYSSDLAIGVRKDWPELRSIFDKALAAIDENERRAIRQDSLAIRYDIEVDYTLLWQVLAGAAILLSLSLLWISQIRRQKTALAKAKAEADQANRFKSYFLANMSHEIRTPMNAIMGFSHLALQTQLTSRQFHYVDKIKTSAQSLLGVINDILDFSKIEAGKLEIERIPFSLDEVLENLASLTALRAEEKGLEILFNRDLKIAAKLVGDPLRLGQVLINLTGNAIKFTEKGEVMVSALLEEKRESGIAIRFTVQDTGIGIDPKEMPRLFKPFNQLDGSTTRRYGGSGLGLSISKHLIELMQGRLEVDSKPGEGSRFSFVIPYQVYADTVPENWIPESSLRGLRVLVVDDNPTALELLSERLVSFTFDVTLVQSATEAMARLNEENRTESNAYRLVLMDWRMPGLNGIEAGRLIKQNRDKLSVVPAVILITAYGREEVMLQAEEAGLDAILIKPVSPSVLFDTVVRVLNDEDDQETIRDNKQAVLKRLSGTVLLVEDNHINQQLAQELLEGMGLMVHTVSNGALAIEALDRHLFDLVLMDLQMPEMDGYEATRRIRADGRFNDLPLIAMTAHAMAEERVQCLAAGMDEHLPKPIDPAQLHAVLGRWLKPATEKVPPQPLEASAGDDRELPARLPGIDLRWGLERVGGNSRLYLDLLGEFVENHGQDLERLNLSFKRGEISSARHILHTLEGVAGNIGAHTLQQESKALNNSITNGGANIETPPDAFRQAFVELFGGLRNYLDTLTSTLSTPPVQISPIAADSEIEQQLASLDDALAAGNAEAKTLFQNLSNLLTQQDSVVLLNRMSEQIRDYDFDLARDTLKALSKQLRDG